MNIALFSDSYLPTKSGIVTVVIQLRKILEDLGHHVVVVTVYNGQDIPELKADKNLLQLYGLPTPVGNDQYFAIPKNHTVVQFLKAHKIELIHAHTEFSLGQMAVSAGKRLNIPVIASTHTMWEDYYKYYLKVGKFLPKSAIRKAVKIAYKNFFAFINVSNKARNYFTQKQVLPEIPCAVIPNAINAEKFIARNYSEEDKLEIRKQYGFTTEDKIVLYVGRVVEEKRILELLETAKRFVQKDPHVKMCFVGAGAPLEEMKADVKKNNLQDKIIFTGFVDWFEVSKLYAIGDVFVTVSLSEMHSMTVLEALNLGLPVVCRRDSSFEDTVFPGENGYMCDTDEEIDDCILKILKDSELKQKMSEKALEIAKRFTLRIHGLRTEAFYKVVLENYPENVTSEMLQTAVDKCTE